VSRGLRSWEGIRSRGQRSFILRYGVGISVVYTVLLAAFMYWRSAEVFRFTPGLRSQMVLFWAAAILLFAPLFGWLWGWFSWHVMERWYRRRRGKVAAGA
jgi:phosphotransferase system  glucose/maltose/N-acetylglucosamine-specific IIC component